MRQLACVSRRPFDTRQRIFDSGESGVCGGRPILRPFERALRIPAFTRSLRQLLEFRFFFLQDGKSLVGYYVRRNESEDRQGSQEKVGED